MRKQEVITYKGIEKLFDKKFNERVSKVLIEQRKEFESNVERYMGMLYEKFHSDLIAHTEHIPTIMKDVSELKDDVATLKEDMNTVKGILGIQALIRE